MHVQSSQIFSSYFQSQYLKDSDILIFNTSEPTELQEENFSYGIVIILCAISLVILLSICFLGYTIHWACKSNRKRRIPYNHTEEGGMSFGVYRNGSDRLQQVDPSGEYVRAAPAETDVQLLSYVNNYELEFLPRPEVRRERRSRFEALNARELIRNDDINNNNHSLFSVPPPSYEDLPDLLPSYHEATQSQSISESKPTVFVIPRSDDERIIWEYPMDDSLC